LASEARFRCAGAGIPVLGAQGAERPHGESGHSSELALDLAIDSTLKANEQLLVEHGGDPLKRRKLRDVGALLKPRNRDGQPTGLRF
jgi:hypothetical protein